VAAATSLRTRQRALVRRAHGRRNGNGVHMLRTLVTRFSSAAIAAQPKISADQSR
jgi:hypothetical protein